MYRKYLIIIFLLISSMNLYGRYILRDEPKITNDVITRLNSLYLSENYKDCIDSCEYYLPRYRCTEWAYEYHTYRDWDKDKYFTLVSNKIGH